MKKILFKIILGPQFDIIINGRSLRVSGFNSIPRPLMDKILLTFPFLYKLKIVNYETSLSLKNGIKELLNAIEQVSNIEGNIIECGSARCGSTVIMGNYLKKNKIDKKIFACDSFEGFDQDEVTKEIENGNTRADQETAYTNTSYEYVLKKIKKLRLSQYLIVIKGYFQDTLSSIDSKFSLALIDADLEKSITFASESIWPKLSKGGVMLFDEYNNYLFKGAKIAIDNFIKKHGNEINKHYLLNRLYYVEKKK